MEKMLNLKVGVMMNMRKKYGFTLIEMMVVVIILAILGAISVSYYYKTLESNKAQSAKNNLLAIAAAQEKFNEDYSSACSSQGISPCYCVSTGTNPTGLTSLCGNNTADLVTNLKLTGFSSSDPFYANYSCNTTSSPFRCRTTDGVDTLTLIFNATQMGFTVTCAPDSCT